MQPERAVSPVHDQVEFVLIIDNASHGRLNKVRLYGLMFRIMSPSIMVYFVKCQIIYEFYKRITL